MTKIRCLMSMAALWQNPIVLPGVNIAGPLAHAWADSNLFVLGSVDINSQHYCSWTRDFLSVTDMRSCTLYKDRFASHGPGDRVSESDTLLWASDCQVWDSTYYLYYCSPDRKFTQDVIQSWLPRRV